MIWLLFGFFGKRHFGGKNYFGYFLDDWATIIPTSGTNPIKILQHKFYTTLIYKHLDWLINLRSQSECSKI